jgi:hypothetical protein
VQPDYGALNRSFSLRAQDSAFVYDMAVRKLRAQIPASELKTCPRMERRK